MAHAHIHAHAHACTHARTETHIHTHRRCRWMRWMTAAQPWPLQWRRCWRTCSRQQQRGPLRGLPPLPPPHRPPLHGSNPRWGHSWYTTRRVCVPPQTLCPWGTCRGPVLVLRCLDPGILEWVSSQVMIMLLVGYLTVSVCWPSALHCHPCLTHYSPGNVPNPTPGPLMSTPLVKTGQPSV